MNIQVEVLLLQKKDSVTLIYVNGQIVRHVRLNVPHPERVTPTWLGESVGHYEGDTLVIDTIGIKPQGELAVIDRYGTPHSDGLHVIERYRLIDGAEAADAMRKHRRNFTADPATVRFDIYGAEFDWHTGKKGLQVEVTVDDPKIFTRPWTGLLTYRPMTRWPEMVCAENLRESHGPDRDVPIDTAADF
jgi:hypothetical protein